MWTLYNMQQNISKNFTDEELAAFLTNKVGVINNHIKTSKREQTGWRPQFLFNDLTSVGTVASGFFLITGCCKDYNTSISKYQYCLLGSDIPDFVAQNSQVPIYNIISNNASDISGWFRDNLGTQVSISDIDYCIATKNGFLIIEEKENYRDTMQWPQKQSYHEVVTEVFKKP